MLMGLSIKQAANTNSFRFMAVYNLRICAIGKQLYIVIFLAQYLSRIE